VGTAARFSTPWGIVMDGHCTIYVSDFHNGCIRKVTPAGLTVSTLCGNKEWGFADGAAAAVWSGKGHTTSSLLTTVTTASARLPRRTYVHRRWHAAGLEVPQAKALQTMKLLPRASTLRMQ